jgi:methylglutaconyl-CoA hydratase
MTTDNDNNHLVSIDGAGVATVTLNRPELRNAFDDRLIADLTATFARLGADDAVRAVVLRGAGKAFSAGGDLNWMRRMAGYSEAENVADAKQLAKLMRTLDELPKPTVAAVHGACYAGGMGLVACADIAIAADDAVFSLSEVRLGLVPAVISPYVTRAIGPRAMRRYALTAEQIGAAEALRIGFVHEVVPAAGLDEAVGRVVAALAAGGVAAQAQTKELLAAVAFRPIDDAVTGRTAKTIAAARAGAEAREGLTAFFEKRKPAWQQQQRKV